ncbi:MAG: DUF3109 family protein [Gracilimonas sp.]|uniref:DUF3109 family protein n=1 Tax=Gracilimonas TaxID=649462 RepID=UPI001B1BE152|nr:DUF3109 family protein [Gracilimonas sp.]MBO6586087.1 DUF3109 family protein [Gracilimonas sp.]MBO6614744.1 DUF3109 family protein [Gracilimonas sp.]
MFKVKNTILSDDIATAQFACDLPRCKGACCVVGDAGAPVAKEEIPALNKAYHLLKSELQKEAVEIAEKDGVVIGTQDSGYEISTVESDDCIFVKYDKNDVAYCAIQQAYFDGRLKWEKPISCHLFPVRLKKIADFDYANFEYVPKLCSAACERGENENIYLAEFLEKPLVRRYGEKWFASFIEACKEIREKEKHAT